MKHLEGTDSRTLTDASFTTFLEDWSLEYFNMVISSNVGLQWGLPSLDSKLPATPQHLASPFVILLQRLQDSRHHSHQWILQHSKVYPPCNNITSDNIWSMLQTGVELIGNAQLPVQSCSWPSKQCSNFTPCIGCKVFNSTLHCHTVSFHQLKFGSLQ